MGFTNALFFPFLLPAALAFQSILLDRASTIRATRSNRNLATESAFRSPTLRGFSLNTLSIRARLRRQASSGIDDVDDFRVLAELLPGADVKSIVRRQVNKSFVFLKDRPEELSYY